MLRMITYEPAPARALNTSSGSVELLNERLDGAPGVGDGSLQRTIVKSATVSSVLGGSGGEVLPEQRVVNVT